MTYKNNEKGSVFVQGPLPDDAQFLGRWLLSAHKLERMTVEVCAAAGHHLGSNPELGFDAGSFSFAAMLFARSFMESFGHFTIPVDMVYITHFALMVELGFFRQSGTTYYMALPDDFTRAEVSCAVGRLFESDDDDLVLVEEALSILDEVTVAKLEEAIEPLSWQAQKALLSGSGAAN